MRVCFFCFALLLFSSFPISLFFLLVLTFISRMPCTKVYYRVPFCYREFIQYSFMCVYYMAQQKKNVFVWILHNDMQELKKRKRVRASEWVNERVRDVRKYQFTWSIELPNQWNSPKQWQPQIDHFRYMHMCACVNMRYVYVCQCFFFIISGWVSLFFFKKKKYRKCDTLLYK